MGGVGATGDAGATEAVGATRAAGAMGTAGAMGAAGATGAVGGTARHVASIIMSKHFVSWELPTFFISLINKSISQLDLVLLVSRAWCSGAKMEAMLVCDSIEGFCCRHGPYICKKGCVFGSQLPLI